MKPAVALLACLIPTFAVSQERMIVKEVVVDVPVAEAWRAWATRDGIQSFFAPEAVIEARPDGAYFIHFNPYAAPGLRGADDMRVLAVQENRMISHRLEAAAGGAQGRREPTPKVGLPDPAEPPQPTVGKGYNRPCSEEVR